MSGRESRARAQALLLTLGNGMVHVAETRIDSSVAAMIVGTVPLQIVGMPLLAGDSPSRSTRVSALAGLAGSRSSSHRASGWAPPRSDSR